MKRPRPAPPRSALPTAPRLAEEEGDAASAWHALSIEATYRQVLSDPQGLSTAEAMRRLHTEGANTLDRVRADSVLRIAARQINNPLIWLLFGAAAIAIVLGKLTDGAVVLAVVLLNSTIGFIQEHRASRAIEALRSLVPEHATVLRAGRLQSVPVASIVRGDLIQLTAGDRVPADMRLVAARNLRIEEAALTGESAPAAKGTQPVMADAAIGDRRSIAYSGTLVISGAGLGVVVATGTRTELGRISELLQHADELETPLTKALAVIGKSVTVGVLALALAIMAIGIWRATAVGIPVGEAVRDMLVFAIALAVGAIPEGLPAIVTIALAIGIQRMAARRAIIRNLPAVETLGSTTVICTDKTGTLTRNEMTVREVWTPAGGACAIEGVGYEPIGAFRQHGSQLEAAPTDVQRLLEAAALCSDATLHQVDGRWTIGGDPTEAALVIAAEKAGRNVEALRRSSPRLDVIPFESENQFMASLHRTPDGRRLFLKGAPEVVVPRCQREGGADAAGVLVEAQRLASHGMRVLAVAERRLDSDSDTLDFDRLGAEFCLLGLVAMIDPPRKEAIEAVAACRAAGIAVKMITGDHALTAAAIGKELGISSDGQAFTGAALARGGPSALRTAALDTAVFARVAPEQKLELVDALQQAGHVVAMTGDGVNDGPALKQANVGVAMGITGTSVAKEAADIVLTDDNFATIVAAVEEGRRVYDNLVKSLAFVLPTNLALALTLTCAVLWFPFDLAAGDLLLPITAPQLLWINLVAAVALALPLAFETHEPDVMRRPPRAASEPILSPFVLRRTALVGVLMTAGTVGVFLWEYGRYIDAKASVPAALAEAQTIAVTTMIGFQAFYMLNCRSLRESLFAIGLTSNRWVFVGIGTVALLQGAFIYTRPLQTVFGTLPLDAKDLLLSMTVSAMILPLIGFEKWLTSRAVRKSKGRGSVEKPTP